MNHPLILIALAGLLVLLGSRPVSAASRAYPPIGTKFFPAKAGDRILITAEMSSPNWERLTQALGSGMNDFLSNQFKDASGMHTVESLTSTPIENGVKIAAVIRYATDTNIPLGKMIAPIELPGPGGTTPYVVESGSLTLISARNIVTGQEVSV